MGLELNASQTELLREILNAAYRDLKYEIAATDNSTFKSGLREREQLLGSLLNEFGGTLPDEP